MEYNTKNSGIAHITLPVIASDELVERVVNIAFRN